MAHTDWIPLGFRRRNEKLVEMDHIQHSLKQLQEAHVLMKQKYEDEIMRLRHKLEAHPHGQGSESEGRTPVSVVFPV